MGYLIKKDSKVKKVKNIKKNMEGFTFVPKKKQRVNKITVINEKMTDDILSLKAADLIKKATLIALNALYDENSDITGTQFALSEIDRIKSIIMNQYKKIEKQKKIFFIQQLEQLQQQLNIKMQMSMNYQFYDTEDKSRGGR